MLHELHGKLASCNKLLTADEDRAPLLPDTDNEKLFLRKPTSTPPNYRDSRVFYIQRRLALHSHMAPDIKEAKRDPRAWDSLTPPLADFLLEAISSMGFARMTYANPLWPLKEQFLTIEFQSCTSGYNSTGMCGKYANSSSHPLLTLHGSFLPIKML